MINSDNKSSNINDGYNLSYNSLSNDNSINYDNNKLLSKLSIHYLILEENHNEKTNYITDQLILYLFLTNIYFICSFDSFAR